MDKPKFIGCGTGCQVGAAVRYAAKLEAKIAAYEKTDMLGLQAKVERLEAVLRKISDIAETGDMEWLIDTVEATLEWLIDTVEAELEDK